MIVSAVTDKPLYSTPSKNIITHTGATGHVTLKDNKVTYGPFTDVQPLAFELSTLHYENGKPMLTITELVRDLEVSHWGNNLAVEEHYALRNDGAK